MQRKGTDRQTAFRSPKLIVAAAALAAGFNGAAWADSVTIAGRMDGGFEYIDNGQSKQERVDSGTYTASRLIFKGTEDVDSDLSVLFYLEHRFNLDTGTAASATNFWNAGSYVGLSSKSFGTVTLGRQYVPIFWSFLFADDTGPLRLHGYSAVQSVQRSNFARISAAASPIKTAGSLDSIASGVYSVGISSAFENNMVIYKTPSLGGATVMLAAGAPEGYPAGGGKILGTNVEYRNGGFYGSLAYNSKEGKVPAGVGPGRDKIVETLGSAMYDIDGHFKVWGNLHPWRFESQGIKLDGRDGMLGVSYWFPKDEVWVNVATKKINDCVDCNSRGFGLGVHHFLSKRTELYASYAKVNNDANSANTLNGFAPANFGLSVSGIAAGIAHQF